MDYLLQVNKTFGNITRKLGDFMIPSQGNNFKPGFLRGNLLIYLVLSILMVKVVTVAFYLPISQNFFFADITKIDLLNLLNENRQSLGLNRLTENANLNQAAYLKAQDMLKNNYFAHKSPQGITPWFWFGQAGYTYKYAGENLAVGFVDSKTVYEAWLNSPGHKENLLNSHYTDVGTAVVSGFEGNSILVVQEFGSPRTAVTAPKPTKTTPATVVKPTTPLEKLETPSQPQTPEPTQPTQTPEIQNSVISKVLGQATQYIEKPKNNSKNTFYLRLLNFMIYDGQTAFQYFSYMLLAVLVGYLFINEILMIGVQNRIMILKLAVCIVILTASLWINKDVLAYILPYQITI